jgi:hypothetical protein
MAKIPQDALLLYHRQGDLLRLKTESMTNHELRELMVGIWARLDSADRADHIRELQSYQNDQDGFLSQVASSISRGVAGENAVNLADVAKRLTRELP